LRAGVRAALAAVILPAASALILLGLGTFLAVSDWQQSPGFALSALNGRFLVVVPALVVAVGVALSAWAKWVRRSPYFAPGGSVAGDLTPAEAGPVGAPGPALAAE